jgi:hypothetical protein
MGWLRRLTDSDRTRIDNDFFRALDPPSEQGFKRLCLALLFAIGVWGQILWWLVLPGILNQMPSSLPFLYLWVDWAGQIFCFTSTIAVFLALLQVGREGCFNLIGMVVRSLIICALISVLLASLLTFMQIPTYPFHRPATNPINKADSTRRR